MRSLTVLLLAGIAAFCAGTASADDPSLYVIEEVHTTSLSVGLRFAPDGRLFYVEVYSGRVRYYPDTSSTSVAVTWATLPVITGPELGLDGLAFHPEFPDSPFVYVYYSTEDLTYGKHNRLSRLRDSSGVGVDEKILRIMGTATVHHNGGRLAFGPDGYLYVTVGDADTLTNADDVNTIRGKILRLTTMAQTAPGNPFGPGNPVFAYGIRNSFGLCFDAQTGHGYFTENGPSCDDELNYLQAGADYGWGVGDFCGSQPAGTVLPMVNHTPTIAPTGCWLFRGSGIPSMQGNLFYGGFTDGIIRRAFINPANPALVDSVQEFPTLNAQVLDFTEGPDGLLWLCTQSRIWRVRPLFTASVEPGAGPARLAAWPNPFRGSVALAPPGAGTLASLDVIDIAGRRLWSWSGAAAARITWDGRDANGHALPAGVYLVRATGENGEVYRVRLVKTER